MITASRNGRILPAVALCLLILIVGVPASSSVPDERIICSSIVSASCTWRNDLDNKDGAWKMTLEPSRGVGHIAHSSYCLVPTWRQLSPSTDSSTSLVAEFHSAWVSGSVGQMCLQFAYRLKDSFDSASDRAAKLSLLKRVSGSCSQEVRSSVNELSGKKFKSLLCHNEVVWHSASSPLEESRVGLWSRQHVSLESSSDFKLIFEGTIPANNPNARICVDNITAYHRPCHQIAASAYEASMRRWLEPIVFIFIGALAFALLIAVVIFAIRVNRRRGKKLSPGGSSGGSEDGSASPQRSSRNQQQQHHRRQQEAMLLHAERLADGPAASTVPIGHGHGPRRPAPPVPPAQPCLDEMLLNNGHRCAAAAASHDPPPRYEEAMGLVAAAAAGASTSSNDGAQQPPPHPPRLNRKSGGHVV